MGCRRQSNQLPSSMPATAAFSRALFFSRCARDIKLLLEPLYSDCIGGRSALFPKTAYHTAPSFIHLTNVNLIVLTAFSKQKMHDFYLPALDMLSQS